MSAYVPPVYVGDLCPKCSWILTLRDFALGRCGHCFRTVPIDRSAIAKLDDLRSEVVE